MDQCWVVACDSQAGKHHPDQGSALLAALEASWQVPEGDVITPAVHQLSTSCVTLTCGGCGWSDRIHHGTLVGALVAARDRLHTMMGTTDGVRCLQCRSPRPAFKAVANPAWTPVVPDPACPGCGDAIPAGERIRLCRSCGQAWSQPA